MSNSVLPFTKIIYEETSENGLTIFMYTIITSGVPWQPCFTQAMVPARDSILIQGSTLTNRENKFKGRRARQKRERKEHKGYCKESACELHKNWPKLHLNPWLIVVGWLFCLLQFFKAVEGFFHCRHIENSSEPHWWPNYLYVSDFKISLACRNFS